MIDVSIGDATFALPESNKAFSAYVEQAPVCLELEVRYWYCLAASDGLTVVNRSVTDANGRIFNTMSLSKGYGETGNFLCLTGPLLGFVGATISDKQSQMITRQYVFGANLYQGDLLLRGLNSKPITLLEQHQKNNIAQFGGTLGTEALNHFKGRFKQKSFLGSLSWLLSERTGIPIDESDLIKAAQVYSGAALKKGCKFYST